MSVLPPWLCLYLYARIGIASDKAWTGLPAAVKIDVPTKITASIVIVHDRSKHAVTTSPPS